MVAGFKFKEIRQIASISKKLKIDKSKLPMLMNARKEGRPEEEVIAELLNVPAGVDAKTYLQENLTEQEYETLRGIIEKMTGGAGTDPLADKK